MSDQAGVSIEDLRRRERSAKDKYDRLRWARDSMDHKAYLARVEYDKARYALEDALQGSGEVKS